MSHLIPDRFGVLAHNGDQQVTVVLRWERRLLEVTMHLAITAYGSEADLFAAFRDAALSVFPPDSQRDPRTVTDPDGSRYIAAFTHPDHTPRTWRQWHRTTGRELAAAGLPVRLNPGHHISLTAPAEALRV
ncbi:SseB family protein [Streptomyces canus]|uniref:SseB family protein n=1 Tax=Streptomyces canus TaxID=58343 RepID=UPI003696CBE0